MYGTTSSFNGFGTLGLGLAIMCCAVSFGLTRADGAGGQHGLHLSGERIEYCARNGIESPFGHLGCKPEEIARTNSPNTRRLVGGALFVSARQ